MDFFEKMKFSIIRTRFRQEVAGGRSTRFRARTHALSGPEHAWNNYGKFHFFSKIHHFPHFTACFGDAAPDGSEALLWSNVYGGAGYGP